MRTTFSLSRQRTKAATNSFQMKQGKTIGEKYRTSRSIEYRTVRCSRRSSSALHELSAVHKKFERCLRQRKSMNEAETRAEYIHPASRAVGTTQRLESLYQQKLAALDVLKKSLLHQAFSGQLVAGRTRPSGLGVRCVWCLTRRGAGCRSPVAGWGEFCAGECSFLLTALRSACRWPCIWNGRMC